MAHAYSTWEARVKRIALFVAVLVSSVPLISASGWRVAVSDLLINSSKVGLQFVGKGLAEMVAVELIKSKSITLVDREQRTKCMAELEFALSDMADSESQVDLGRMLAADYIVVGEIIDMDQQLLIAMRMVDVETGEVVWGDAVLESLSRYEYISGYLAASMLRSLELEVPSSTEKKVESRRAKIEEAALAFSKAMDLYDKKEISEAKSELARARTIDPDSEVVRLYMRKLTPTSPKFQVEIDSYAPTYNPASYALPDSGLFYLWTSMGLRIGGEETIQVADYDLKERGGTSRIGVILPLGQRLGLGAEAVFAMAINMVSSSAFDPIYLSYSEVNLDNRAYGAYLGLGYRLTESISLGAAVQGSFIDDTPSHTGTILADNSKFNVSSDIGFLLRLWEERVLLDVHGVHTTQTETYYDEATMDIMPGRLPVILAGSLSVALFAKRAYISLKGNVDLYPRDRPGYTIRATPALEVWPLGALSLRGGYEYAQMELADRFNVGHGGFGGLTLVLGTWEFSGNFTWRHKPIHVLPGYSLADMTVMVGLIRNGSFARRNHRSPQLVVRPRPGGA